MMDRSGFLKAMGAAPLLAWLRPEKEAVEVTEKAPALLAAVPSGAVGVAGNGVLWIEGVGAVHTLEWEAEQRHEVEDMPRWDRPGSTPMITRKYGVMRATVIPTPALYAWLSNPGAAVAVHYDQDGRRYRIPRAMPANGMSMTKYGGAVTMSLELLGSELEVSYVG